MRIVFHFFCGGMYGVQINIDLSELFQEPSPEGNSHFYWLAGDDRAGLHNWDPKKS
jgi:hypothetical protein